jgi:hypothetical protein
MSIRADPVIACSPIELDVDADVARALPALARGRPIVIDYFAARHGALTVGDITVDFRAGGLDPRYVEIEPVAAQRVIVERHLLSLVADGARLVWVRRLLGRRLAIRSDQPERWISFLERHPANHGR